MNDTPHTFAGMKARSYRGLHIANGVLFAALWVFTIGGYGHLPEQVPQYMGLTGEVTRWADRGMWFFAPLLMSTQLIVIYGIASAVTTPNGMNVPQKKRLLALPREAQAWALAPMRGFMFGIASWVLLLTIAVQIEFFIAARRGHGSALLLPLLGVLILVLLAGMWWKSRQVARRVDVIEQSLAPAREADPA